MDRGLQTPALVLLDEVGSGTDPIEGGALGVADRRSLPPPRCATLDGDEPLRRAEDVNASTTEGVASAAFGFDTDTFAPTYQLVYGSPGRSLALEIAARLGQNPSIIAAARENLSAREAKLAEHLAKIDRDMRALDTSDGGPRTGNPRRIRNADPAARRGVEAARRDVPPPPQ